MSSCSASNLSKQTGGVPRAIYSSLATLHAMLGLLQFGQHMDLLPSFLSYSGATQFLLCYVCIRLFLAVVQIPAHAMALFAGRYTNQGADYIAKMVGKGDRDAGVEEHYKLINKCNVAIGITICLEVALFVTTWVCDVATTSFYVTELISIFILMVVLSSRIYAICADKVREMFYLDWFPGYGMPATAT